MRELFEYISLGFDLSVLGRLGLAVLLGGLIGLEREKRSRPAGLRTMIIVCLGATIIMIVSAHVPMQFLRGPGEEVIRVDPARIAAGIVTGIGFLGAGVVLKLGDIVRGVTTAATIWFVAGLGIVIGQSHYVLAVTATILALVVLWAMHYVEALFRTGVYRSVTLEVDSGRSGEVLDEARAALEEAGAALMDLKTREVAAEGRTELRFDIKIKQQFQAHDVVKRMVGFEGVLSADWQ
jgi:putative Mg2+ transporter-C (MgtC) family protein